MAIINKGKSFANGEQLTADKLNQVTDNATFASGAVDSVSTQLSGGAIIVKDSGVTTAKIADDAVTTAKLADSNVTKAKIENVADMKVLGNTSGSAAAPQEVSVLDEDDMSSDSATALATQQSIKSYVDDSSTDGFSPTTYAGGESVTLPNGLIMKWGVVEDSPYGNTGVNIVTFGTAFPTAIINVQASWSTTNTGFTNPVYIKGDSVSTTGLTINNLSGTADVYWQAIGY
jgi:hypothetical protein